MAVTKEIQSYSPSVNIIRDKGKQLRYIPTSNSQLAFEQIVKLAPAGTRSFTLVGAYGSGKSTFLWALAESANTEVKYFDHFDYLLRGYPKNQLLDFVGDFNSIMHAFAKELKCEKEEVLDNLKKYADDLKKKQTALIIRIDEFGKFLEFAAKTNPEGEFYFLQQLAELANDQQKNILLITTLHQDFAAYSYHLSEKQKNEWLKVKGRFKEITFNEPVEQLLLVAADSLSNIDFVTDEVLLKDLLKVVEQSKAFPLKDYFSLEIAKKLSPLEILAGSTLTLALQRYGQNERSLFSFLESNDYRGLTQFLDKPDAKLYNLVHVYDYLVYHYYNQLIIKENAEFRNWRLLKDSLEKAEGLFDKLLPEATQVIKIIGLLNIFGKASIQIDKAFLISYTQLVLNQKQTEEVIRQLEQFKIIRFRAHSKRFVLFEGTDVDIEYAIDEAGNIVGQIANVSRYLNEYFQFPVLPAKRYQMEVGTPRYFEIIVSDEPIYEAAKGERDGFINLIFSSNLNENDILHYSTRNEEAILYVFFKNTDQIKEEITQIEKIKQAKAKHNNDKVARHEFDQILNHHQNILRYFVLDRFFTADNNYVSFFFRGSDVTEVITNRRSLNNFLSEVAYAAYPHTPHFLNEMVNKTKLSTPIVTARKNLINRLIENFDEPDLGFDPKYFPPERTIYLSLVRNKGFHREVDGVFQLAEPNDQSFDAVWACFNAFLDDAKHAKLSLQEFVDRLLDKPYKLKRGFIDFILPISLLVRQSDFSLFNQDGFIPKLSADILDLVVKKPSDYSVKSFSATGVHLSVFNKYRELLNQKEETRTTNQGFIEIIRPFLAFYNSLTPYSKHTKKIAKEAINLRHAISESTDPEKTFFEDFPQAIGYSLAELDENQDKLERYFTDLRAAITDIRTSYQDLMTRYEAFVLDEIVGDSNLPFEEWKKLLQMRYKDIKSYLIPSHLKVFFQRINSNIEDKETWLSSLAHAVIGKQLEEINDQDELVLFNKFKTWFHELDNYRDLQKDIIEDQFQNTISVEITSANKGVLKQVLSLPKSKEGSVKAIELKLSKELSNDKDLNIFILGKMLNELMK